MAFFCACENKEAKRPELNFDYTCNAEITVDDELYKTKIEKDQNGWKFIYSYPAELDGMVVEISGESYTVSYSGLEMERSRDDIPDSNVCDFLAKSLDYITFGSGIEFTESDGITKGRGVLDGGDFSVTYDKKNSPSKLEIGESITVTIKSFKKA